MTLCSPWATLTDLAACGCPDSSPSIVNAALTQASEILYMRTGLQFPGECTATVRPCSNRGQIGGFNWYTWTYPWYPIRTGGEWINIGPCGCNLATDCGCKPYPKVNLGRRDIQSVTSVTIGGTVVDPETYRLDGHQFLVRTEGGWPCCQDLGKNLGEPGTWSADVTYGDPVPEALKAAAASLATEIVKACEGDNSCRLPSRTQNLVKQGVSMNFIDLGPALSGGMVGLYDVDLAIAAWNPNGLQQRPRVLSPDLASGNWS